MQINTAAEVLALSDEQFKDHAWDILTNRGANRGAKAAAQRRFRRMGGRAFLALQSDDGGNCLNMWGFTFPGDANPYEDTAIIFEGVTLDHAAHKIGGGDARKGWRLYWNS